MAWPPFIVGYSTQRQGDGTAVMKMSGMGRHNENLGVLQPRGFLPLNAWKTWWLVSVHGHEMVIIDVQQVSEISVFEFLRFDGVQTWLNL